MKKVRIKGIAEDIQVNEDGTKILYRGKLIKTHLIKSSKHSKGYLACSIASKSLYVHKIVAEAYVVNPKPLSYRIVLHKNGDSLDNNCNNLMWGNFAALYKHRIDLKIPGAGVSVNDKTYRGSSTISYEEALKIAARLDKGEFAKNICREYNVSEMSIARIRKRYCKNKSASPRYDKSIKQTVLKLAEKYPPSEVSKISGINYHTVYRWVNSAKVKMLVDQDN